MNLYSDGLCTCVCLLFCRCLICFGLVVVARLSVCCFGWWELLCEWFAFNSVVIVISLFCGEFLLGLACWGVGCVSCG